MDYTKAFVDESPDALIAVATDGKILFWNKGAEQIFGYTSEEALGRFITDLIVPLEKFDEVQKSILEAVEKGSIIYESFRRRKDGSFVYADICKKAVKDANGNIEFISISQRDITQLKVLRDAKLIETKFRDLLESTPDAIVMVNRAGRVVLSNSQAESMFGYNRGELLGKPVEILLPDRFRDGHVKFRTDYFSEPKTRAMGAGLELYGLRKVGEEFSIEIGLSPLKTEEGPLVMAAIRDITDRKELQAELRRKNLELEEQNRQIQEANRLKSEFLANMSHELRTPLNAIIGFSEFLIDEKPGALNSKQKEYLNDVLNSGKHLLKLINDVLDLSKVESGKMRLVPETFRTEEAVSEVVSVLRPIADEKSIEIIIRSSPAIVKVKLDMQKFKQILYNLLSNAIKFTDENGTVEIFLDSFDSDILRLQIRDTGIGIKKEDFGKLFEEFQQLDSGAGRLYQGTGLGLALTKKIVELQKGRIDVESEVGIGSAFTVVLPYEKGDDR